MRVEFHFHNDVPYIRISSPHDPGTVSDRAVNEAHKQIYSKEWAVFLAADKKLNKEEQAAQKTVAAAAEERTKGLAEKAAAGAKKWRKDRQRHHVGAA